MILNRTPEPQSRTRVVLALGITAVACLGPSGCSGSGQTTTAKAAPVPSRAGAGSCVYDSTDGANAGGLIAIASWQEVTDTVKANRITLSPLNGLGDQAFTGFAGAGYPALVIRQGNVGFEISIHGPHITSLTDHGLATAEDLARLVLTRL